MDFVTPAKILGIRMSLLTLQSEIYKDVIKDPSSNRVLHLTEITKILEKLIKDEKDI